jgi:hypothetical protein
MGLASCGRIAYLWGQRFTTPPIRRLPKVTYIVFTVDQFRAANFYTGGAGPHFLASDPIEAFEYSSIAEAELRAASLSRMSGLTFEVDNRAAFCIGADVLDEDFDDAADDGYGWERQALARAEASI